MRGGADQEIKRSRDQEMDEVGRLGRGTEKRMKLEGGPNWGRIGAELG